MGCRRLGEAHRLPGAGLEKVHLGDVNNEVGGLKGQAQLLIHHWAADRVPGARFRGRAPRQPLNTTRQAWRGLGHGRCFRWAAGGVTAGADLYLDGERIPLDDEGFGLVPRSDAPRSGELRYPAQGRRCVVQLSPGADEATCTPGP